MKNYIFAAALIIAGAILVAASILVNENPIIYLGLALLVWGTCERIFPVLRGLYHEDKNDHEDKK